MYTKHLDSHPPQGQGQESPTHKRRHLTFIYYLNETVQGGDLRIYDPQVIYNICNNYTVIYNVDMCVIMYA
jgi:hypothetical protein